MVPTDPVEAIKRGKGHIDTAQDAIDLAAFFRTHTQAMAGKTPVTPAQIDEASILGTNLLTLLRPGHAPTDATPSPQMSEAVDVRDRLWTLLIAGHDLLWQAGAIAFGKTVDDHVPPLQSRVVAKKPAKDPTPAPTK